MEREGEASIEIGRVITTGRAAYHPDGYFYCPGQGVFEFSVVRRPHCDGWRWVFTCFRQNALPELPRDGWVTLPTWLEDMRQAET